MTGIKQETVCRKKEKKDIWWSQKTRFINAKYCR